jgi:hypothetical protein
MKLISFVAIFHLAHAVATGARTDGNQVAIRATFNGGQPLPTDEVCTKAEWDSIVSTQSDDPNKRQLRGEIFKLLIKPKRPPTARPPTRAPSTEMKCNRKLTYPRMDCPPLPPSPRIPRTKPAKRPTSPPVDKPIDYYCLSFCNPIFPDCRPYGKNCSTIPMELPGNDRKLNSQAGGTTVTGQVTTCDGEIALINKALDDLEPLLSPGCRAVIQSSRDYTCVSKTKACGITGFSLWNAKSGTVIDKNFATGESFCRNDFPFSIEALADSCVDTVQFDLVGIKGYHHDQTEFKRPFFLFRNNGKKIVGKTLDTGTYTLTAYPNEDVSLAKMITFTVNDC